MTSTALVNRKAFWVSALTVSALGTWILYDAQPGLNWGLWVAAASIAVIVSRLASQKKVKTHSCLLLAFATLVAFSQSVTAVGVQTPLIIANALILFGLAIITLDDSAAGITLPSVAQVPFAAVSRVLRQTFAELLRVPANARPAPRNRVIRIVFLTVPIVLILGALLSSADPILDSVRETLFGWLANWTLDGRLFFYLLLLAITLGAFALAAGVREQHPPSVPDVPPPFRISIAESRILLGSVNAILWLFLVMQLVGLTLDPGGATGSGITYAEYARRGFAELSIAAGIVLGVILFVETFSETGEKSRRFDFAAIVAVEIILALAFRRVLLYENAYGFTSDRIFAQAYMLVLAASLILLARDLSLGAVSSSFGRKGMMLTLTAFIVCFFWNYEGFVAHKNLERGANGGRLDLSYLEDMSPGAIPTIVAELDKIPAAARAAFEAKLRCKQITPRTKWYEWNYRREQGRIALAKLGESCTAIPPSPSSG